MKKIIHVVELPDQLEKKVANGPTSKLKNSQKNNLSSHQKCQVFLSLVISIFPYFFDCFPILLSVLFGHFNITSTVLSLFSPLF
jgi:hypothetical protein